MALWPHRPTGEHARQRAGDDVVTAGDATSTTTIDEAGSPAVVAGAGALLVGKQGWSYDQWDGLV